MRKAPPRIHEKHVVTPHIRQLLSLILCYADLMSAEHAASYAEVSQTEFDARLESLRQGDSSAWTSLKDGVDEIHHALEMERATLNIGDMSFTVLWREVWSRSIYGSSQNLIIMQANIRQQLFNIDDDGLHKITHAVTAAAYEAYCAAGKFDRTAVVVVNGKTLREAVSIA